MPLKNVEDEDHAGYLAACAFAGLDGEPEMTDFEIKSYFWDDLSEQAADELADAAPLVDMLSEGRSFFGEPIDGQCGYAWFTRDEAQRLRDAFARAADADDQGDLAEGLTDEDEGAIVCLDQIIRSGRDVWVHFS